MPPRTSLIRCITVAGLACSVLAPGIVCSPAKTDTPAYQRWGITRPTADAWAEEKLADAYRLLYGLEFDRARELYAEVAQRFPNSAEAHLGLSMALRYLGDRRETFVESQKAYELDPDAAGVLCNHADLLASYRGIELPEPLTGEERNRLSNELDARAARLRHPLNAYPHTQLWANHMGGGRLDEARAQLVELGRKGYFPAVLDELAHNMLVALEPDAILFTNGDNDTYPLYVLQEHGDFRRDVAVVNLSLLNLPVVAGMMRDSFDVPISLPDEVLAVLQPLEKPDGRTKLPADLIVDNIISNARKDGRPVYFATTCYYDRWADHADEMTLEGLVYRVREPGAPKEDLGRIIENMTAVYRLDSVIAPVTWPANLSPITRTTSGLGVNYAALYDVMADHYIETQNADSAALCLREVARITHHDGRDDLALDALDEWLGLDPDNAEARDLKERYSGN